jgi:hypothetical protein
MRDFDLLRGSADGAKWMSKSEHRRRATHVTLPSSGELV